MNQPNKDLQAVGNPAPDIALSILMEAADDDRETAATLLDLYFRLTTEALESLRKALADGNWETVAAQAHKCSGSSAVCGMSRLADLLRQLEQQAQEPAAEPLQPALEAVLAEFTAVKTFLENHFNRSFNPA